MAMDFPESNIRAARLVGAKLLQNAGLTAEPVEVAMAVEKHRWAWKPENVRLVLIAESHVYTTPEDLQIKVLKSCLPVAAQHAPSEFVRLIYCLGYGEPEILSNPAIQRNSGTIQFWDIFGRVAGTGQQPRKTHGSTSSERLAWKVRTLTTMHGKGIWLSDASLHGIYAPGGQRINQYLLAGLHQAWWDAYGKPLLNSTPGVKVWAIGSGVAKQLATLGCRIDGWIYQPNAQIQTSLRETRWPNLLQVCVSL